MLFWCLHFRCQIGLHEHLSGYRIVYMVMAIMEGFYETAERCRDGVELFSGWGEWSFQMRSLGGVAHEFDKLTRATSECINTIRFRDVDTGCSCRAFVGVLDCFGSVQRQ